jgi:hypothetical protein
MQVTRHVTYSQRIIPSACILPLSQCEDFLGLGLLS